MSRLRAPFTILAAITAFGVDDGTSVELIPHKMANNDRPFPLDQSERISPFLRRTGTIKRGHATEIPIYRD